MSVFWNLRLTFFLPLHCGVTRNTHGCEHDCVCDSRRKAPENIFEQILHPGQGHCIICVLFCHGFTNLCSITCRSAPHEVDKGDLISFVPRLEYHGLTLQLWI